jgi:hypothetical protein
MDTYIMPKRPPPAAVPPAACSTELKPYGQCGGRTAKCAVDTICPGFCCSNGYSCQRDNEWYWQCKPAVPLQAPLSRAAASECRDSDS